MPTKRFARSFVPWLVPVVMLLLAARQHYLARTSNLSPWEGGGFGMFASADLPTARFLRISVTTADDSSHKGILPVGIGLERGLKQLQAMPTPERVQAFAERLAVETWVPADYSPFEPAGIDLDRRSLYRALGEGEPAPGTASSPAPSFIEVKIFRRVFDPSVEMVRIEPVVRARADIQAQ